MFIPIPSGRSVLLERTSKALARASLARATLVNRFSFFQKIRVQNLVNQRKMAAAMAMK